MYKVYGWKNFGAAGIFPAMLDAIIGSFFRRIDRSLEGSSPSITILSTLIVKLVLSIISRPYGCKWGETSKDYVARIALKSRSIKQMYLSDIQKQKLEFIHSVQKKWHQFGEPFTRLPQKGVGFDEAYRLIDRYDAIVRKNIEGVHFSGCIYMPDEEVEKAPHRPSMAALFAYITEKAYLWNSLHMDEFAIGFFIQYQVVQMLAHKYGAIGSEASGFVTSGGTESLMLAVRIYEQWGRQEKSLNIGEGVILVANTIHAAVLKGAKDAHVHVHFVAVDENGKMKPEDLREALNFHGHNAIAVFASAPGYGTGTIDPLEDIGQITNHYKVPFHVDMCLGGFIAEVKPLAIKGVTSMSIDTHKNGLAPKGSSVLITKHNFSDYAIYTFPDWEVIYGTPKAEGSQSCVPAFQALIALLMNGEEGYQSQADAIILARKKIHQILTDKNNFIIMGQPTVNVIAFKINERWHPASIYTFAHEMKKRRFVLNALKDNRVHLCVTGRFVSDPSASDNFKIAMEESLIVVAKAHEAHKIHGTQFSGDAGLYGSIDAALRPTLKTKKAAEKILLGKRGASDAVRAYISAELNPFVEEKPFI